MFDAVNNLPADDPLRAASANAPAASAAAATWVAEASDAQPATPKVSGDSKASRLVGLLPEKVLAAFTRQWRSGFCDARRGGWRSGYAQSSGDCAAVQSRGNGSVVVDAGARVAVPSFTGTRYAT